MVVSTALILTSCSTPPLPIPTPPKPLFPHGKIIQPGMGLTPESIKMDLYHTVAPGETLWRISKMYEVDVETLKRVNDISDVHDMDIGLSLYIPKAVSRKNVITLYPSKKWKYIIIHHSATDEGNSKLFDEVHKRKGWAGVGYHFVVDNGTYGKDNGQIETTPRWTKQQRGAHCSASKMNYRGIGICLVGNFSKDKVSKDQLNSLVFMVQQLQKFYNIPDSRIMGHGQVPGASTECPGKYFPWYRFKSMLANR